MVIQAPTYGFVGASDLTDAATLAITAAPTAGTNATIKHRMALWVQDGGTVIGSLPSTATQSAGLHLYGASLAVQNDSTGALGVNTSGGGFFGNASQLATAADQRLAIFVGGVINASGTNRRLAGFTMFSAEAHTDSSHLGAYIRVETIENGSGTTARSERVRFDHDGNVLIGTTTNGMTTHGSLAIAQDLAHRGSYAGFYNTTPVAKPAAITAAVTTVTHTAPAADDYAISSPVTSGGYMFANANEFNSAMKALANAQTRIADLYSRIQSLGLIT
jgi:hypothetical protein